MPQRQRKWYWLGLTVIAGLVVVYAHRHDLYGRYFTHLDKQQQVRELRLELEQRLRSEQGLRERVEGLNSDPIEMEAVIRRDQNLVRPGEKIFRVEISPDGAQAKGE